MFQFEVCHSRENNESMEGNELAFILWLWDCLE